MARRPVVELSGGQQQRVSIARALSSDPELLVLDEPIAGVDADSQRLFRDSLVHLVAEHGAAVLLVSHELGAVADDLDRVLVMKRTLLFDGSPQQLTEQGVSLGVADHALPLWLESIE
jgi:zinc transport system ATP-binding protein